MRPESNHPPLPAVDVAVVGAGVVGTAIARELAVRGVSVAVLDKAPNAAAGCSYANAAILSPSHVTPLATPALLREAPVQMARRPAAVRVRPDLGLIPWLGRLAGSALPGRSGPAGTRLRELAEQSTRLHAELAEAGLNPTFRKAGAIDVYLRQPRRGSPGPLSPADLRALVPGLAIAAGGSHQTEEWIVESRSFATAMLDDARRHGAVAHFDTEVRQLLIDDGTVTGLGTSNGNLTAGQVVIAGGVESGALAGQAGVRLPLRGGRGYGIDLGAPADLLPMAVRLKEHRVVITPLPDRIRICGSIEFGPESRPADLTRADALRAVAIRAIPELAELPVIDRWSGERPCTSDGVPAIGPTERVGNLSFAVGHGMWGLILAPVTAKVLADQLIDVRQDPDLAWLAPDRFTRAARVRTAPMAGARNSGRRRPSFDRAQR